MKKILLCTTLFLFAAFQINAQTFTEEQVEGVWEIKDEGIEYDDYISSIRRIEIGNIIYKLEQGGRIEYYYYSGFIYCKWGEKMINLDPDYTDEFNSNILDYSIINNTLHVIVSDAFTLHFKIVELDENTMKLQTKKGIMAFNKVKTSQIQEVENGEKGVEKERYNLNGHKIDTPEKGINIVKMTDNSSHKELVK
ncbi:hypothetical protein [Prevotella koreensis]